MTMRLSILLALLAASSLACGSEDAGSTGGPGHQHSEGGEHDHFSQGMRRATDQGLYEVTLYSDPAPPAVGTNTFTLGVTGSDGASLTGATVSVTPSMPSHGHGSNADPVVIEEGAGVYHVENVVLQMMGIWQFDIVVETEAGPDLVRFTFDIK
jgi:YtkA-like